VASQTQHRRVDSGTHGERSSLERCKTIRSSIGKKQAERGKVKEGDTLLLVLYVGGAQRFGETVERWEVAKKPEGRDKI